MLKSIVPILCLFLLASCGAPPPASNLGQTPVPTATPAPQPIKIVVSGDNSLVGEYKYTPEKYSELRTALDKEGREKDTISIILYTLLDNGKKENIYIFSKGGNTNIVLS